jgi:hypothetical protein
MLYTEHFLTGEDLRVAQATAIVAPEREDQSSLFFASFA